MRIAASLLAVALVASIVACADGSSTDNSGDNTGGSGAQDSGPAVQTNPSGDAGSGGTLVSKDSGTSSGKDSGSGGGTDSGGGGGGTDSGGGGGGGGDCDTSGINGIKYAAEALSSATTTCPCLATECCYGSLVCVPL